MPRSITAATLSHSPDDYILVDVRKSAARLASNQTIRNALYRSHTDVIDWLHTVRGKSVVVFCVHGHEVSQGVCSTLISHGIDAWYLEGGFDAWAGGGQPTIEIEERDQ
ncbi:MAG TPA: rhodanese-like domain-containing protein [Rhizobiaceae bacterium]|nr:rhodanese-like domain-containing protein [Rhizobiaceae bacterium]